MTMQYDILGNPIGDDGQPSIDQMQYELAKNGKPSPLDTAVNAIKNVAINNNPLMLRKQGIDLAGDIPRVMASGVAPYIAGITQPVVGAYQYASKMPGVLYREKVLGDPESMQEAATIRAGLPQFAPPGARYNPEPMNQRIEAIGQAVAPQTPQGQTVLEGATQVFEPLKLPMIGPGSGLPGTSRVSPRPFITPNDVRVLGAEATRVGRQIGEIPTDFVNAQSGLQRIDPVTGQPVLGARIQSGVDRLGDIMEQRKMQGLTPIPGLPAALQPETSMYAVRPQGTKLTVPTVPASAKGYVPDIDPIESLFRDINIDVNEPTATPDVIDSLIDKQMKSADNPNQARSAFNYFLEEKARGVYPDAPNGAQALQALKVSLYGSGQMVPKINSLYDEFLNTEQGKEFLPNAVQTSELAERHDAAVEGLKNMWGKYLVKNLGTEGNPAVRMAAQEGLTYLPAEDVLDLAQRERSTAQSHRRNAGVPIEGSFVADINALSNEIEAFNLPIKNAANAEKSLLEQRNTAINLAKQDPSMEAHAKELDALHKTAKKTATNLTRQKADLQKKLDKLRLAEAYETLEDAYVAPIDAKTLLEKIPYAEQQFYPDLKEAAKRGEMAYKAYDRRFKGIGIVDAAQQFYNDVITGNIPKDKAPTLPVDRYLHETAKARIQDVQAYRTNVLNMIKTEATAIPENKKFGNVGVIELTRDTPEDIANKEAALSTEALDICIGEGGGGDGTRNFFTKKKDPRWTPIVDIYTGKPNPNASRHTTSYVQSIYSGGELPMFRDLETGMPVAALQFLPSSSVGVNGQPRFNIGYASGESNGRIETKYVNGIRDYLNSRADDIAGIGDRLEANAGIYDTKNRTSLSTARRAAQVSENDMKGVDWNAMPRFMTAEDVKQAVKSNVPAVIPQQTPAFQEDIGQLQTALVDNIEFVVNEAIQNSNLDAPEELERRLGIVFSAMQSQYFPTLLTDPISSLNRALEYLEYEIDRRSNNASELSQEMVTALERYSAELESARDDLVSQQQRAQQPAPQALAPQAQMQQAEQLLQQIERPLRSANDGIVNDALQEYARSLQRYASNQLQNGMDPITVANGMRDTINTLRNIVLTQPTDPTRNFMTDQLGEYVSALRLAIDGIGQWIESQQQQVPVQPQRANLPAEVQQNADQRNQDISNAYLNALIPNTNIGIIDQSLSEFADLLHDMSTNMFGNGLNTAEIVDRLQDRIRTEITELSNTDRVMNRGLNVAEADMIRSRLNDAYGNLNMIREMGVPAPEPQPALDFEPDTMHGANQYTATNIISMARELFEQERMDANNFDIPSIQDSIHALQAGVFDDERIRQLPEQQRQPFADDVAFRLQNMLDEMRDRQVQPVRPEPTTAPYRPIPAIIHAMSDQAITADMTPEERNRVQVMFETLTDVNMPGELQNIVSLARSYAMGFWENFSDVQREWLARNIEEYIGDNPPPNTPPEEAPATELEQHWRNNVFNGDLTERQALTSLNNLANNTNLSVEDLEALRSIVNDPDSPQFRVADDDTLRQYNDVIDQAISRREPPQRRGPFRPGGASAVRGIPLGNLNIQPSITAEAFKGSDRQPLSNFLQQVKSMPGVTQEGLKTGLMAFENMDPSQQMTKAEFARELLPSSYDIVDLANSSRRNVHDLEYLDDHLDDDDVLDQFKEAHNIPANLRDDIATYTVYDEFSGALQKYLAKKGIRNEEEFNDAIAAVRKEMVDAQYEDYLAENYPEEDNSPNLDPYQYRTTQRLVEDDASTQYMEFGVTHPDQTKSYTHYPEAPEGVIGHIRGSYNLNKPDILKSNGKGFVGKSNSFVIEEIQSDAQKGSAQKAHLHQVHGVLFKAAIQKALESGANTVYLPTAETIASVRRERTGWEERLDDQGLTVEVPTFGEIKTNRFAPIYDQAVVKEGLKPLLKIPGVTSKMVNGYHEIRFTPEAKEHILNGPGQTIPGYKKGGRVHQFPSVEQMKHELMMRRA